MITTATFFFFFFFFFFFLRGREGLLVTIVESSTAVDSRSQKVGTWI